MVLIAIERGMPDTLDPLNGFWIQTYIECAHERAQCEMCRFLRFPAIAFYRLYMSTLLLLVKRQSIYVGAVLAV